MNPTKTLRILIVLIGAYMIFLAWFLFIQPAVPAEAAEVPGPEIKQGQYTIFQYSQSGWINTLYATEYYIQDRIIYYKDREHQGEYMEIPFEDCLLRPGWIEDVDELMDYGWWEPGESDW